MNKIKLISLSIAMSTCIATMAADPTDTHFSMEECAGSLMPYPIPDHGIILPDSLEPVFINHVGRHGARYPSSPLSAMRMSQALCRADSLRTITPTGLKLQKLVNNILEISHNRWGTLDSLGIAEQRGIASRMFLNFPTLFNNGTVNAISSYVPRCVMSMYEFTHQLDRLNNHNNITTSAGRVNTPLLRPFDIDEDYIQWRKSGGYKKTYDEFIEQTVPSSALKRVLGKEYPLDNDWRELALDEYYVIAGMAAMGQPTDENEYFTIQEYNALWSCFNMRQYLQRTATTLSAIPAEITSQLILDLIRTFDEVIEGHNTATVILRFGHAETLMPLLSQLHLQGCYYITNYFDTVALHWQDFHVVPMASNLQMLLTRSKSGQYYVSTYLNERSIPLIPGDDRTVIPYSEARSYMNHCLPIHIRQ